ncbi:MAG TPA: hypothetical protein VMX33_15115 [bacterium]|nr:hypothetical protein [bacterium]
MSTNTNFSSLAEDFTASIQALARGRVPEVDASLVPGLALEQVALAQRAARADATPNAENLADLLESLKTIFGLVDSVRASVDEPPATFGAYGLAGLNLNDALASARRELARAAARSNIAGRAAAFARPEVR